MYEYYFTFQSITYAQKALSELFRIGIASELIRSPKHLSAAGCSYALTVKSSDGFRAYAAMRSVGIQPLRSLRVYPDGRSEVTLL